MKESLVSKSDFDEFIDTGEVSYEILLGIANKVKQFRLLGKYEFAIFTTKTTEINKILININNQDGDK